MTPPVLREVFFSSVMPGPDRASPLTNLSLDVCSLAR